MRKTLLFFANLLCTFISFSQTVDIIGNPSASALSVFATDLYSANESIYTESEIGAANFTTAANAINKIGFNVFKLGSNTSFNLIKIYLMEVPTGAITLASGTYSTTGYTQVFGGATGETVILSTTGFTEISLTTSFVRTAGNNLQVLIERVDNNSHLSFSYYTANTNNGGILDSTTRRYNGSITLSGTTKLSASKFRAQIRFKHEFTNDAAVSPVYSLGKLPLNNSVPHIVSTTILNNGTNTITALPVTLNVTGSNSFADVQTIATLAPGASAIVNFTAFTPTVTGTNNISVTIPADDYNSNNISSAQQIVNLNTWSYSQGNVSTGTAGFNNTIDLVSKYYNSTATLLSQAAVYFLAKGQPYKIGVWDASGPGGSPGSLLFQTTLQTSVAGLNMVPILPALSVNVGNFYIGVRQTTTTNFNLLRQTESPLRSNTFYYLTPTSLGWVDNSTGSSNRFMIDPKLQTPFDAFLTNITLPNNGAVTCGSSNQTISVQLTNTGANTIAANNATVTLKITGANTQTLSLTNTSNIVSGGNENISFTGISLLNPGTNNVKAYVNLAGDAEPLNDTLIRTQNTIGVGLETAANTYPLTTVCEDLGWTYYNDAAQKSVLAVEWGTNTASKATATASLTLDAALFTATSGSGAGANGTFTLKRYWNVDVAGMQPTTPVNVRFFYDAAEKNATDAAASNFQLANPGSVLKSPSWFKTNSGSFSADGAHVTADAVLNAISLTDVNTTANTINGILYAQFDGITSFSGGTYAAGVGTATLLPVSIDYFKARKAANEHVLNWKLTCIGSAYLKIIVERGNDGKQFDVINEQTATEVRCLQEFIFTDKNPLPGTNFYRLKTITPDGKIIYSKIVALINKPAGFQLIGVSPNPVNSKAAINITTVNSGTFLLLVTDVAGKALVKKTVFVPAGDSFIKLDFDAFGVGTYFVIVTNSVAENSTLRIVKQ